MNHNKLSNENLFILVIFSLIYLSQTRVIKDGLMGKYRQRGWIGFIPVVILWVIVSVFYNI
jgi:hypothetical protein